MDIRIFLKGLVIGFSIAAPVGPIGVLCIRRTLAHGHISGLVSGLGAAAADAVYGCIAGFGLTFVSGFLVDQQVWLRLGGGVFLSYLGVKTLLAAPSKEIALSQHKSLIVDFGSVFLLTLTNPITILSFTAIFAGLGLADASGHYAAAVVLVLGVFTGSSLWWLVLSGGVGLFRQSFKPGGLRWVNRISGTIITGFGLLTLWSLV